MGRLQATMEIRLYKGRYPEVTRLLYQNKILRQYPIQTSRVDLEYDDGLDITYLFKSLPPAKFREYADMLLLAALTEAKRYDDIKWKFAKFNVELNRTAKGASKVGPRREFIAAKNQDSEILVYGEQALGYELPKGAKKPFLIDKVKEILDILDSPSPGPYLSKQRPYKVVSMTISVRVGSKREKEVKPTKEESKELATGKSTTPKELTQ